MLKRETRILGLSGSTIRGKLIVVGVVYRGSLWLDGVVTSTLDPAEHDPDSRIVALVRNTKQFPQIHAIIISRRRALVRNLSTCTIARRVRIPVISISRMELGTHRRAPHTERFTIVIGGKRLTVLAARTRRSDAQRLYSIGCVKDSKIPEAVRVADRLAKELSRTPSRR